jgi:hypothetical protein
MPVRINRDFSGFVLKRDISGRCSGDFYGIERDGAILLWHWRVCDRAPCMMTMYLTHGSDAFALFYDARTKKVQALNGSGRSPKALNVQKLQERGITGRSIPLMDLNSVTVPGTYPSSHQTCNGNHNFHRCCCRLGRLRRDVWQWLSFLR